MNIIPKIVLSASVIIFPLFNNSCEKELLPQPEPELIKEHLVSIFNDTRYEFHLDKSEGTTIFAPFDTTSIYLCDGAHLLYTTWNCIESRDTTVCGFLIFWYDCETKSYCIKYERWYYHLDITNGLFSDSSDFLTLLPSMLNVTYITDR